MDKNIFEALSKQSKIKKNQASYEKPIVVPEQNSDSKLELNDMLQKIHGMKEDLENQISNVYEKGKASKIDVDQLMDNAGASAFKQSEKNREQERILNDKINAVITPESCLKKNEKTQDKLTQERKGKLRGLRNNWMPVR